MNYFLATQTLLDDAIDGDEEALDRLIERLTPVLARRVVRTLVRAGREDAARNREWVRDLTQDVFVDLFADDARILRSWRPERGASLENFIGLVAERRTGRRLQRRRYAATIPTDDDLAERASGAADPERETVARGLWHELLDRLEERLSPAGWEIFLLLFVEQCAVAEIERKTGLGRDAIYAWRSRLRKLVRVLAAEAGVVVDEPPIGRARSAADALSTQHRTQLTDVGGGR
ncbi:MAG: hypothetical protein AAGC60_13675 [Acidobacteriota bacterium]